MAESLDPTRTIGYDLDDVLVATGEAVIGWYNLDKGTTLTIDDWSHPSPDLERWKVDDFSEAVAIVNGYFVERPEKILPIPGAVDFVARRNSEGYSQHIVTGRPKIGLEATLGALATHFGAKCFDSISFTNHYNDVRHQGVRQTKATICKEKGVKTFVEDLPVHATDIASVGIRTIMFGDYMWNRDVTLSKGMRRAYDWAEEEALLDGDEEWK